jgi:hypothetical protein
MLEGSSSTQDAGGARPARGSGWRRGRCLTRRSGDSARSRRRSGPLWAGSSTSSCRAPGTGSSSSRRPRRGAHQPLRAPQRRHRRRRRGGGDGEVIGAVGSTGNSTGRTSTPRSAVTAFPEDPTSTWSWAGERDDGVAPGRARPPRHRPRVTPACSLQPSPTRTPPMVNRVIGVGVNRPWVLRRRGRTDTAPVGVPGTASEFPGFVRGASTLLGGA